MEIGAELEVGVHDDEKLAYDIGDGGRMDCSSMALSSSEADSWGLGSCWPCDGRTIAAEGAKTFSLNGPIVEDVVSETSCYDVGIGVSEGDRCKRQDGDPMEEIGRRCVEVDRTWERTETMAEREDTYWWRRMTER